MRKRMPVILTLILSLFFWGGGLSAVQAGTIYVDAAAGGTANGTSWTDAYTDLQAALSVATSNDEIWVKAGTYKPGTARTDTFQLTNGVALYGHFAGTESAVSERNLDNSANKTILSGDLDGDDSANIAHDEPTRDDNSFHVVTTLNVDNSTILDGFTITGGNATNTSPTDNIYGGGGMHNKGSGSGNACNPVIRNCIFTKNSANGIGGGGGLLNNAYDAGESSPTLSNCDFDDNASAGTGGGVCNFGMTNGKSSPSLTDCTFTANVAVYTAGGMMNDGGSDGLSSPTLIRCTFSRNTADTGGGMVNSGQNGGVSSPVLTDCTFTENSATGSTGGSGGGMVSIGYESGVSNPTLGNCMFNGNSAAHSGGGMTNVGDNGTCSPILSNCVFSGNKAAQMGGGMLNAIENSGTCEPDLDHCSFAGNQADTSGGGMHNSGANPQIKNSIFWMNVQGSWASPTYDQIYDDASSPTVQHSIVQGGYAGTGNKDQDPLFEDAPDPGDNDWTSAGDNDYGDLRLQACSPATDASDNTTGLTTDLNGDPRKKDGDGDSTAVADMGAYETQTLPPEIQVLDGGSNIDDGTTTAIDFGSTEEGSPVSKTFTVKNNGDADLTLSGLSVPSDFSISANFAGTTVAGSSSATFTIRMDATSAGNAGGTVSFTTNDCDEDAFDFPISGTVTSANVPPSGISLTPTPSPVSEGSSLTLNGSFSDADSGDTHTVSIDWGDGTSDTVLNTGAGVSSFSSNHTYTDGPATHTIRVTVNDGSASASKTTNISVNNAEPALSGVKVTVNVDEGGTATLTGDITDPGMQDSHTLDVNWGDGLQETFTYSAGTAEFSETHTYADDNPTGTASDSHTVSLTLTDSDNATDTDSASHTVSNTAPILSDVALTGPADEGSEFTLTGGIADAGSPDSFTLHVDWGDSNEDTYAYSAGTAAFSETHTYADDGEFSVTLTLTDDDTGSDTDDTATATVSNVVPTIELTGDSYVLAARSYTLHLETVSDPGADTVTAYTVDWGDGHTDTYSDVGNVTHTYLSEGDYTIVTDLTDEDGTHTNAGSKAITVGKHRLIITEIMYSPGSDEPAWEWIEVYNPGDTLVDLSAYVIDDDDDNAQSASNISEGTVDAKHTALLFNSDALDASDFEAAWGAGISLVPVTGWADMTLDNDGDKIGLWEDFASYTGDHLTHENVVGGVQYKGSSPWPNVGTTGASVHLTDLEANPAEGASWALSATDGESPTGTGYQSLSSGGNNGGEIGSPQGIQLSASGPLFEDSTQHVTLHFDADGDDAVSPGDTLHYTVLITNTGGRGAAGVVFTCPVPQNASYVADSLAIQISGVSEVPEPTYDGELNQIEWNGDVSLEKDVEISFDVTVSGDAQMGDVISAQGTITYDPNDGSSGNAIAKTDGDIGAPGSQATEISVDGCLKGDADGNGLIELKDAILVAQMLAGMETDDVIRLCSDTNGDRKIGLSEWVYILLTAF